MHYGRIVHEGRVVDEVLLTVMRAPRTFTREDVVEIGCHGGMLVAKAVLDAVLARGARLAEPGEFTKRAFLNGRLDLAQAEAVADVIHARTELALVVANEQLAGKLSRRIGELRDGLMATLAHIEAHIDFPEEDIAPDTREALLNRLDQGLAFMDELLRTADEGRILRRGIRAAIVGRPNVGKSSLLNQLLGHERAIVSAVPGTTRDTIEETANIRGLPVVFIDTAGLREAGDAIEQEGIRRSHESVTRAELILHVLDGSEPLAEEDRRYLDQFAGKKRILVRNKVDRPRRLELPAEITPQPVALCALSGEGVEALKDAIQKNDLGRRNPGRDVAGDDQRAASGRLAPGADRHGTMSGGAGRGCHAGVGGGRSADCGERGGRSRRANGHRRFAGRDLQPVLHWEIA